jgi:hypothetical protein
MLTYQQYERAVYEELMNVRSHDSSFNFSVRQKSSKGAEQDYFIGTEKGKYFGTSFWQIRTGYPGASGDLIDVFFTYTSDLQLTYFFEFNQTKKPYNEQNRHALQLIQALEPGIDNAIGLRKRSNPEQKAHSYSTRSRQTSYSSVPEMIKDVIKDYKIILPLVNMEISKIKSKHPTFEAHQISDEEFREMQERLRARLNHSSEDIIYKKLADQVMISKAISIKHPLNQILFGPPGTGKTYNTINKALEIIGDDEVKKLNWSNREEVKKLFDKKLNEGQIVFTTFHQSMSYEEFIEGIKPVNETAEDDQEPQLTYQVIPGILKNLIDSIEDKNQVAVNNLYIPEEYFKDHVVKMSLGSASDPRDKDIYDYCMSSNQIALGFGFNVDFTGIKDRTDIINRLKESGYQFEGKRDFAIDALERFILWAVEGRLVIVSKGNKKVRSIGVITGAYQYNPSAPIRFHHFKKVKWLYKNIDLEVSAFYEKQLVPQSIYVINTDVLNKDIFIKKESGDAVKNHVLIIDEINRGNVSQIFGELITLIEEDKREGKPEALKVTLPYSKEQFSVPPNLYIIGTMNTADRSVEALDTALRRRFSFTEMPPLYHLEGLQYDYASTRGKDILQTINKRIEKLLDRDHLIGHSYFLLKDGETAANKLTDSFYRNIIPLLQEYFFGDYAKIGAVLGKGFVRVKEVSTEVNLFADFDEFEAADFADKPVYEIVDYRNASTSHTIKKNGKDITMSFEKAIQELMGKLTEAQDA